MPKRKSKTSKPTKKLQNLIGYWVQTLNLTDWKFDIIPADKKLLDDQGAAAYCKLNEQHKLAEVYLPSLTKADREMEFYIVHELLHVVYWNISVRHYKDKREIDLFEQALNSTTEALMKLKYK